MSDTIVSWLLTGLVLAVGSAVLSLVLYLLTFANLRNTCGD